MTQLVDIHLVTCNKQGWVVATGENDSRNVLSGQAFDRDDTLEVGFEEISRNPVSG
jgi:hypothetical protein